MSLKILPTHYVHIIVLFFLMTLNDFAISFHNLVIKSTQISTHHIQHGNTKQVEIHINIEKMGTVN